MDAKNLPVVIEASAEMQKTNGYHGQICVPSANPMSSG